jgi:hypothetical protein
MTMTIPRRGFLASLASFLGLPWAANGRADRVTPEIEAPVTTGNPIRLTIGQEYEFEIVGVRFRGSFQDVEIDFRSPNPMYMTDPREFAVRQRESSATMTWRLVELNQPPYEFS